VSQLGLPQTGIDTTIRDYLSWLEMES